MSRFDDKVALVTGGGSGIGRAIVQRLADEGARVFTAQRRADARFESIVADLSSPTAHDTVIAEVIERPGRLDLLVNSAGIMREALTKPASSRIGKPRWRSTSPRRLC